jgi:hypothetical protein
VDGQLGVSFAELIVATWTFAPDSAVMPETDCDVIEYVPVNALPSLIVTHVWAICVPLTAASDAGAGLPLV